MSPPPPTPIGQIAALAGAMFFRMLGVFLILPIVAVLVGDMEDATPLTVGLALGGYGLTQALLQIPVGILADRYGRKPVLLIALLLFAGGGFVAAAATDVSGIIIGRLLQGSGAVAAAAAAWIADITDEKHRARGMAVFGGAIGIAFIVSLFIAPPLSAVINLSGVFTVAGCFGILSALLILPLPAPKQKQHRQPLPIRELLTNKTLCLCAGGAFALHYAMSAVFFLLPTSLISTLPIAQHWLVYAGGFFLSLLLSVPLILKADKQTYRVNLLAVVAVIIGIALLTVANIVGGAIVALFFFFGGFVALEALLPATATKTAPAHHRATAVGLVMTAEFSGIFLGGAITGFLQRAMDSTINIYVVCLLLAIWLIAIIHNNTHSV